MEKTFTLQDNLFMQRAIELAALGKGNVSPNPLVGCVIVYNNKIIGEGRHKKYGDVHAEVNAINSIAEENKIFLKKSTVYVSLEPCSHYGKTPPCADLLIKEKVKKVVICNNDPNPLVNGKGIQKLKEAGIEVETGLLENEGRELNKRFFTFLEKKRPFIILKWAETADGFLAKKDFSSKWISNDLSRLVVHKMRAEQDAVMVGTNTALHDNPTLNVREWEGKNPVRIVIDKNLRLSKNLKIFDQSQKTICFNFLKEDRIENLHYVKLNNKDNIIPEIINYLFSEKIQSIIIEGGVQLLQSFIDLNLWDEIYLFKSEQVFNDGILAPEFNGRLINIKDLDGDTLFYYRNNIS